MKTIEYFGIKELQNVMEKIHNYSPLIYDETPHCYDLDLCQECPHRECIFNLDYDEDAPDYYLEKICWQIVKFKKVDPAVIEILKILSQ